MRRPTFPRSSSGFYSRYAHGVVMPRTLFCDARHTSRDGKTSRAGGLRPAAGAAFASFCRGHVRRPGPPCRSTMLQRLRGLGPGRAPGNGAPGIPGRSLRLQDPWPWASRHHVRFRWLHEAAGRVHLVHGGLLLPSAAWSEASGPANLDAPADENAWGEDPDPPPGPEPFRWLERFAQRTRWTCCSGKNGRTAPPSCPPAWPNRTSCGRRSETAPCAHRPPTPRRRRSCPRPASGCRHGRRGRPPCGTPGSTG